MAILATHDGYDSENEYLKSILKGMRTGGTIKATKFTDMTYAISPGTIGVYTPSYTAGIAGYYGRSIMTAADVDMLTSKQQQAVVTPPVSPDALLHRIDGLLRCLAAVN